MVSRTNREWKLNTSEFKHKSDRPTVFVGAAFLKAHLGQLIACFLIDDARQAALLLEDERPLGSFSARIRAAYCLGLISPNEFHDLNLILDIRNTFIDEMESASFNDQAIQERCNALKLPRQFFAPAESHNPRELFVFTTTLLTQQLRSRLTQAEKDRRIVPDEFQLIDAPGG
jgi:hypothetical protein